MKKLPLIFAFALVALAGPAAALSTIPPNITSTTQNKPMVMLTASKDFSMFWKAYTDFEDIDFDGVIDYTYKPGFSYYGYFDSDKCYTYETTNSGRFVPAAAVSTSGGDLGKHYCASGATGQWSGNFLNWSTMSRIDVLRKVFFGGLRSYYGTLQNDRYKTGDSATSTTLEESFVPRNSQAFVKYYNGTDLNRVTPFSSATVIQKGITLCRRPAENAGVSHAQGDSLTPQIRVAVGNYALWNMTEVRSCNWWNEPEPSGSTNDPRYTWETPTIAFLTANYQTPIGTLGSANANYVHKASVPVSGTDGATYSAGGGTVGPGFTARVQVCVSGLLESNCKKYGTGAGVVYKPSGLLHDFGESTSSGSQAARAEFGLLMGSYDNNLQAGVLRKNIGEINDEINPTTGQFIDSATGKFRASTAGTGGTSKGGIVQSLSEITLYGYDENTGNYADTCYSDNLANGSCPSWGNPVGELLLESIRYYAGKTPQVTAGTKDTAVGLPVPNGTNGGWVDPLGSTFDNTTINAGQKRYQLYGRGICRPLNIITMSGAINSYDDVSGLTAFSNITGTATAASLTKIIGDKEGITGTTRLVGNNSGPAGNIGGRADLQCTGKTITDLGLVEGACPNGPNFHGTFLGAGVAGYANTHRIRSDLDATANGIPDLPYNAMTVRNYGVTLAGSAATIEVPLPGNANCSVASGGLGNPACPRVYITPASLDSIRAPALPGNMVDFKVLGTATDVNGFASGSALVLWQHSMLGEDQDQDQLDSIRWVVGGTVAAPTVTIYTQAIEANTGSTQPFGFGYTLVGTGTDGLYMHSGINNYVANTTASISLAAATSNSSCPVPTGSTTTKLCSRLTATGAYIRGETYKTFNMTGATNVKLNEPLWYIAKYGGFKYTSDDKAAATDLYPTRLNQWDRKKADGTSCAGTVADPCDGNPDNYFYARRPDLLATSLQEILEDIVTSSNTAPAIASSQLQEGDLKVVATFNAGDGSGALRSYALQADGSFASPGNETWSAETLLTQTAWNARQVITNDAAVGQAFTWAALSSAKQVVLQTTVGGVNNGGTYGQELLQWLRGDTSYASLFRARAAASILGPIVNSNPTIQKRPNGRYFGTAFTGYADFVSAWSSRRLLLWAGAGDGMLHGFDASATSLGGKPILSYVPDPVFANLKAYADPNEAKVQSFVDGSPFVGDVKVSGTWATYLFSSLGRGGKGIFALDVTNAGTVATDASGLTTVSGAQLDEAHASSIFKWQLTGADDTDLGYIVTEPTLNRATNQPGQIAMMNNGRFAALFGNGVESTTGNAALFIVFADGNAAGSGGKYKKLVVPTSTCSTTVTSPAVDCNGLSQVTWIDTNNDRVADYIYAGDLKGNLWRFDVSSADPNNWSVSYFGKPLFKAIDAGNHPLPITGAPVVNFHPLGGMIVDIVTGTALYAATDFPNTTRTNAMFGVWDKSTFSNGSLATAAAMEAALPRSLSSLATRTLVNYGDDLHRYVTGDAIDWGAKNGWSMFFNVSSEMGLNNLTIANGQVLTVTVSPAPALTGAATDPCTSTPVARLVGVDPVTGLPSGLLGSANVTDPTMKSILPSYVTYMLATVPVTDQKGQFVSDLVGRGSTQAGCASGSLNCTAYEGATSGGENPRLSSSLSSGRIFWREIPGFKTR